MSTKEFKTFLKKVLTRGLKDKYVDYIFENENSKFYLDQFKEAFTHKSADERFNYEIEEHVGDACLKHITVKYIDARWPGLGLPLRTPLSQKMYSKVGLSNIARGLGFEPHIKLESHMNKSNLEDVFESFIGVTERIIDTIWGFGMGYKVTYNILASIWQEQSFELTEESLLGYKTMLKQNVWDKLIWKKDPLNKHVGPGVFDTMWTSRTYYWNKSNNRWRSQDFKVSDSDNTDLPYSVKAVFDPYGTLIAYVASNDTEMSTKEVGKRAYKLYKDTNIIAIPKPEKPGIIPFKINELPPKYQEFTRNRENEGLTYSELITNSGLYNYITKYVQGVRKMITD